MWWKNSQSEVDSLQNMVERQIKTRGVKNEAVLNAMLKVDRRLFVSESQLAFAYYDEPQPIGEGQTISQPYIVALMTELLDPHPTDRVLEVGTGSGYQAAILAEIVRHVYTLEIIPALEKRAERLLLDELGYKNITVRLGNGYEGWQEEAPFDKIIVTAAPEQVPDALVEQVAIGGRLVLPVGTYYQVLCVIKKDKTGVHREESIPVRFVPMTGEKSSGDI